MILISEEECWFSAGWIATEESRLLVLAVTRHWAELSLAETGHVITDAVRPLVEIPSHVAPRRVGQGGEGV